MEVSLRVNRESTDWRATGINVARPRAPCEKESNARSLVVTGNDSRLVLLFGCNLKTTSHSHTQGPESHSA